MHDKLGELERRWLRTQDPADLERLRLEYQRLNAPRSWAVLAASDPWRAVIRCRNLVSTEPCGPSMGMDHEELRSIEEASGRELPGRMYEFFRVFGAFVASARLGVRPPAEILNRGFVGPIWRSEGYLDSPSNEEPLAGRMPPDQSLGRDGELVPQESEEDDEPGADEWGWDSIQAEYKTNLNAEERAVDPLVSGVFGRTRLPFSTYASRRLLALLIGCRMGLLPSRFVTNPRRLGACGWLNQAEVADVFRRETGDQTVIFGGWQTPMAGRLLIFKDQFISVSGSEVSWFRLPGASDKPRELLERAGFADRSRTRGVKFIKRPESDQLEFHKVADEIREDLISQHGNGATRPQIQLRRQREFSIEHFEDSISFAMTAVEFVKHVSCLYGWAEKLRQAGLAKAEFM